MRIARTPLTLVGALLVLSSACGGAPRVEQAKPGTAGKTSPTAVASATSPAPSASLERKVSPAASAAPSTEPGSAPYRGSNAFEAPPSAPREKFAPPPERPPGTAPPADKQAREAADCAAIKLCGVCNNAGYCGFCEASRTCVPKDQYGPLPGTCAGGYTPTHCPMALYLEVEEPKIRERLAGLMGDLQPDGMPLDRKASESGSLQIPVQRGRCYGLVFRESYDLNGYLDVRSAVEAKFLGDGGDWVPIYRETAAITPFCPQADGRVVINVTPHDTTQGVWRAQLFSAPIPEAVLREAKRQHEAAEQAKALRYYCGFCARVQVACFLAGEPQCAAKYAACLGGVGLTPTDCETGDVPRPPEPKPLPGARATF